MLNASPPADIGLSRHVRDAHVRVRRAVAAESFHPTQGALLSATVERMLARSSGAIVSDPLGTMFLLARAHRRLDPEAASRVGAFCLLYVMALDLFDDVQDEDLAGKPHAEAGAAIAINSAITLSFLANRELHDALPHLDDDEQRRSLLAIADRAGLAAVAGQHRDLMGSEGAVTPEDVLAMQEAKTSSVILLAECGALLGGASEEDRARHRRIGEHLARLVQVRDDLRDLYGKRDSPDLATGKVTYPVACYLEGAGTRGPAELARLRALPDALIEVRTLLYHSGAVRQSAGTIEHYRRAIHTELAAVHATARGYLRLVLDVVDGLARAVYAVPAFAPSAALREPGSGPFATRVLAALEQLRARLSPHGLPDDLPALLPWHLPHWMYLPSQHAIFFPDVDDLGDEILPFQAELLGSADVDEPRRLLTAQVPLVLAHELFHFWRDAAERLTEDHWHEEWAANRLAVAYAAEHEPAALREAVALADRVVARFPRELGPETDRLLGDCTRSRPDGHGYGMSAMATAVVGLEMVRRLAHRPVGLAESITELLRSPTIAASA